MWFFVLIILATLAGVALSEFLFRLEMRAK
jgi:hypothetical protein